MRSMCGLWAVLLTILLAHSALAGEFTGKVIGVLDGDTIEVLNGHHTGRIRLSGIDCPENGQPFGTQAKHATSEFVFGKDVKIQTHGKDKYGHVITDVLLPDEINVNCVLPSNGPPIIIEQ